MGRRPINRAKEQEVAVEFGKRDYNGIYHTHNGHKISAKEEKFIQNILLGMSKPDAAEKAGFPRGNGSEIFNRKKISEEIKYRMDSIKDANIADSKEIMEYFTRVMRGQEKDQFQLDAPLSERTKAAVELMKSVVEVEEKAAENTAPELKITLDWARNGKEK